MTDIDWIAVDQVVTENIPMKLTPTEKRMVVRRLESRMLTADDWYWSPKTAAKLTTPQVAELLFLSPRSVERMCKDLPPATEQVCPECGQRMWVYPNRIVEAHPTAYPDEECVLSETRLPAPVRGLAALRPDLYRWVEVSA